MGQSARLLLWQTGRIESAGGGVKDIAEQLGVNPGTLRNRQKPVEIDTGQRTGTTTEDKERTAQREWGTGSCGGPTRFSGRRRLSRGPRDYAESPSSAEMASEA